MLKSFLKSKIRFDRNELAGAFGDIGTDFPLVVSLILVGGLDPASVLIMFGAMQIMTGLIYGIPMPVQPLKAMAVIVITQKLTGNVLYAAGLAIGLTMLFLTVTNLLAWLGKVIPKCVIRGIQFGLGLQLAILALKDYVSSDGVSGYILAAASFVIVIVLLGNRKYPASLFVIVLGLIYALALKINTSALAHGISFSLPQFHAITPKDMWLGFIILTLPQIPLSIGNSVLATRQVAEDYFPEKKLGIRKIGLTYSLMNLIVPFFGGIPVCHGSGGMVGHYTFGGRTGGSVAIYGTMYLILGLFFSGIFGQAILLFPKPMLGVILAFEGWALMKLVKDLKDSRADFGIALLVGLMAIGLPYGYVIGLAVGTLLAMLVERKIIKLS
ncbi:MAG TPA: putative sulfate/molybdate transporter [Candidatus Omnitrophota bacterium]|nr:putative sulfate/molybdate transporter [Candidatus Omnitrophota bacterium]HPD85602.1 putative sulfate/molybdate transporter [Candidatus Omnitrophota bacterium]HRZ04530.1 putative sulfate/molybdate transporter [Candidatus Omnitrophota bacterium]